MILFCYIAKILYLSIKVVTLLVIVDLSKVIEVQETLSFESQADFCVA
jgi:hypothetical protein